MFNVADGVTRGKSIPANPVLEAALTRTNQERAREKWELIETAEEVMKFSRHYIYARGALNQRFRRLLALLEEARDELQEIADIDADFEIRKEWREAGSQS